MEWEEANTERGICDLRLDDPRCPNRLRPVAKISGLTRSDWWSGSNLESVPFGIVERRHGGSWR